METAIKKILRCFVYGKRIGEWKIIKIRHNEESESRECNTHSTYWNQKKREETKSNQLNEAVMAEQGHKLVMFNY